MPTRSSKDTEHSMHVGESFSRLPFIDFVRGLAMVLMALDHASLYWNKGRVANEGLMGFRPEYVNVAQFLTRFITHYCAPTFVFLAGSAIALSTFRRSKAGSSQKEITLRMIKRGVILVLLDFTVVGTAYGYNPIFGTSPIYFGVLSCIGLSLIIFSVARLLSTGRILASSIIVILLHSYLSLNWISRENGWGFCARVMLHEPTMLPSAWCTGLYPIIPWIGVLGLGWCFGRYIAEHSENLHALKDRIARNSAVLGLASIVLFFAVRVTNGYGNLLLRQGSDIEDFMSFSKYPPDLAFLSWTLGGMAILVALALKYEEVLKFAPFRQVRLFGRVPLFFYCMHLYVYLMVPVALRALSSFSLQVTYLAWVVGLVLLYPICLKYDGLKRRRPASFLQYL
jgi:uncharacterized membrane protein